MLPHIPAVVDHSIWQPPSLTQQVLPHRTKTHLQKIKHNVHKANNKQHIMADKACVQGAKEKILVY